MPENTDGLLSYAEDLERICLAADDAVALCRPGGPLAALPRARVAQVSRTAKWLRRALGQLVSRDAGLAAALARYVVPDDPTDAELDALARKLEEDRYA